MFGGAAIYHQPTEQQRDLKQDVVNAPCDTQRRSWTTQVVKFLFGSPGDQNMTIHINSYRGVPPCRVGIVDQRRPVVKPGSP